VIPLEADYLRVQVVSKYLALLVIRDRLLMSTKLGAILVLFCVHGGAQGISR
jgi:hypothetical protein